MEFLQKDIVGYEGLYQITSDGKVWSLKNCKFLKPLLSGPKGKEYYYVCLSKNGVKKNHKIHRLVAEAFIPNPNNLPIVNHKDENKENNRIDNLEWVTSKENCNYGTRNFRSSMKRNIPVECIETGIIYKSFHEASKKTGTEIACISMCCTGYRNRQTAGGYHWRYA